MTTPKSRSTKKKKDACADYLKYQRLQYRTHQCYICPERNSTSVDSGHPYDVTLVTQLLLNRLDALERLLKIWTGPASVALYMTDKDTAILSSFVASSQILSSRTNVFYHIVYQRGVSSYKGRGAVFSSD